MHCRRGNRDDLEVAHALDFSQNFTTFTQFCG